VTELENTHYVSDGDGSHYVLFWWVSGCEFPPFERAAKEYRYTCDLEPLTTVDDRRLYRLTTASLPEEKMLFPHFRYHDTTVLDNEASADGFWVRLRTPGRGRLKTLVEELDRLDADPTVERIYQPDAADGSGIGLTDRQRELLDIAAARGYFETPSRVTLDELAADLEISAQTLSQHIRAGVRKLVETEVCDSVESSTGGTS
jgi:predicted DNA binding protein